MYTKVPSRQVKVHLVSHLSTKVRLSTRVNQPRVSVCYCQSESKLVPIDHTKLSAHCLVIIFHGHSHV